VKEMEGTWWGGIPGEREGKRKGERRRGKG